jgi:hypothetical protein
LTTGSNYDGYDLEPAYNLAREQLSGIEDIEQLCLKSGARYLVTGSQEEIIVEYLSQSYRVTMPNIEILPTDSQEDISIRDKVVILHYLLSAKGTPIASKLIAFQDLPGGGNYFRTFSKRSIEPLVEHFGGQPHLLIDAARKLGGQRATNGDVSVAIDAFSRVPITITLWRVDEEFPPQGSMLFDATISDYLSTYDITVLCESIAWRLVTLSREQRTSD